jgi:hypothetical protein
LVVDANPTFFTKFGRRKKKKFPIFREKSGEQLAPQWRLSGTGHSPFFCGETVFNLKKF